MDCKLICNAAYLGARTDDRLFGSFIEHMGRVVYSGVYEPSHASADEDGFRRDVLNAVHDMHLSCVRYPGGNFVSNYNWRDGVGPRAERPRRPELAWRSIETNAFGLNEFMQWSQKAQVEPILSVNLGTGSVQSALELLEYCNFPAGTTFSALRRSHGVEKPYNIRLWCLGNEMDGRWQLGHRSAQEYASLAAQAGRAMKQLDPSISLAVCGSSKSDMPSFPDWDLAVLEQTYDLVDYLSVHQYYGGQTLGTAAFLAQAIDMDRYLNTLRSALCVTKQRWKTSHNVYLSLDEWGVWARPAASVDQEVAAHPWQIAPAISEQIYTHEDAMLFSSMLLSMLRHADIVKIGCQALLTNISACLMTEPNGGLWRQTTYYPFAAISAHGRGRLLQTVLDSPAYSCDAFTEVPYLDHVAVWNEAKREAVFFAVNRSPDESLNLQLSLQGFGSPKNIVHDQLYAQNPFTTNQLQHDAVTMQRCSTPKENADGCTLSLPPLSFHTIRFLY